MTAAPQDHLAFERVFAELYGPLCSYAFTYLKAPELCEDAVQEVFTRVWERRRDLLGTEGLRFYLFTSVRNTCISHLRLEKKSEQYVREGPGTGGETSHEPAIQTQEDADYQQLLREAIDQLPEKCREVFVLSRLSQMRYKEIAEALGISAKTVENQIGKALKQIRAFLKSRGMVTIW